MTGGYVAKYLRVSDDDDDIDGEKQESNSIVNQRRMLDNFIAENEELSPYAVKEFVDDGVSGVNFQRTGIQKLLQEVRENKINCVIVKDLSRFGRNYIEVGDYIEQIFPFLGVRFISVSDNFDSAKCSAGLEIGFKNLMHDLYSRDLSKKIKSVKSLMQKIGAYSGGDVPYGYICSGVKGQPYIPDPEAAEIVRKIFFLAGAGNSTTKIADRLNAEGVLIPGEYKNSHTNNHYQLKNEKRRLWNASQVGLIIRNEVYVGTFVGRKLSTVKPREVRKNDRAEYIRIENHHEKLVEEEQFEKAQKIIRVGKKRKGYKKDEHPSALKGKIKCGCCGYAMSLKRTAKREYYYCRMGEGCGSYTKIEKEMLESVTKKILQKLAELYQKQDKELQDNNLQILSAVSKMKEHKRLLEINAEHCKESRLELYYQWKEGRLQTDEYVSMKEELIQKENEYLTELDSFIHKLADIESAGKISTQDSRLSLFSETQELTKELVDEVIERIDVHSGNRVEIRWKFTFGDN